jgi:hypothetical protein
MRSSKCKRNLSRVRDLLQEIQERLAASKKAASELAANLCSANKTWQEFPSEDELAEAAKVTGKIAANLQAANEAAEDLPEPR